MPDNHAMPQNDLLTLVREKQAQISKLQAELDEVRELLVGERPPVVNRASIPTRQVVRAGVGRGRGRRKRRDSSVSWAEAVATDHAGPLHVNEMIQRIAQKFGKEIDKQTLVSNLSRLVKENRGWERTGPNTFRLTK